MAKYKDAPLTRVERDLLLQSLDFDLIEMRADLTVLFTIMVRILSETTGEDSAEISNFYIERKQELLRRADRKRRPANQV